MTRQKKATGDPDTDSDADRSKYATKRRAMARAEWKRRQGRAFKLAFAMTFPYKHHGWQWTLLILNSEFSGG